MKPARFRYSLIILSLLGLWQFIVWFYQLPDYILPSPYHVARAIWQYNAILRHEAWPTIIETLAGLLLGVFLGCLTGLVMTLFKGAKHTLLPILIISQAIPTFTIAPLLVIWLGFGMASKIAVTMIMLFFPVTSSFYDGLKQTPNDWLDMAHTMNASRFKQLIYIQIPAALTNLASGIRVAATLAPIGAVVGEWVGASQGLGFLMLNANARLQIDLMFAALMAIITLSLVLYFTLDKLMRVFIFWKPQ